MNSVTGLTVTIPMALKFDIVGKGQSPLGPDPILSKQMLSGSFLESSQWYFLIGFPEKTVF